MGHLPCAMKYSFAMRFLPLVGFVVFAHGMTFAQVADSDATVDGPVTRFVSIRDFDVSLYSVAPLPTAQIRLYWPDGSHVMAKDPVRLFLGEHVAIYQTGGEGANKVEVFQPAVHAVDGIATVEAVLPGAEMEVRADGYQIRIDAKTKVKYEKPFAAASDVTPNAVLKYKGMLQKDGTVLASTATFFENEVTPDMLKARKEFEYDPSAVFADSHQSGPSRNMRGTDARLFPLHGDAAMQARVSAIGAKLLPEYQRNLKPDDPARINFRFFVVDGPKGSEASYALPSGIVLVPSQMVQKLGDDSQLAAVLADAIASLIEVQPLALPLSNGDITKSAVKNAAAMVAIGVIGTSILNASAEDRVQKDAEQRARVSLSLMRDAGFDPTVAPQAWSAFARDEAHPVGVIELPPMAKYLYGRIAEVEAVEAGVLVGKKR